MNTNRRGFMGFLSGIPLFWSLRPEGKVVGEVVPPSGPLKMILTTDDGEAFYASNPYWADRDVTIVSAFRLDNNKGGPFAPVHLLTGDSLTLDFTTEITLEGIK